MTYISKISKEEFEKRLKDNKFFKNCDEQKAYRAPVVIYFINNHIHPKLSNLELIDENNDFEFRAINHAFNIIKLKLKL